MTKYVVVTGGVVSGIGKGIVTASIARLLPSNGKIVTVKCDGYLNVDPGTMSPVEHGEVFVLDDGAEVDMDFGHYERFLGITCKADWSMTSGKVFDRLITKERRGAFLGQTIQIYPHVIAEIKQWWRSLADAEQADIVTIEVGGTVGDIENSWFIEAARQLRKEVGDSNVVYVHVTYVPVLESVGEPKTKPAQRDVALLHEKGIRPDVIVVRSRQLLNDRLREKLALFCDVETAQVVSAPDVPVVYEIPLFFRDQRLYQLVRERLSLTGVSKLAQWEQIVKKMVSPAQQVVVGICGKYTQLHDSYASIIEALRHAGAHHNAGITLKWIDTEVVEQGGTNNLIGINGIIVPGGFGGRGVEGKITVIKHAREHNLPFLGICYGLQLAVVDFARHVCGLKDANSTECDTDTPFPVIDILPGQQGITTKGGTMRLGACEAKLVPGTRVQTLYGTPHARERHRHRYEVNPKFHDVLQQNGLVFSGTSQDGRLVEFIELPNHPFFVATQAHNELTSRLEAPNPLFKGFVEALCSNAASSQPNQKSAEKNENYSSPLVKVHTLTEKSL